MSNTKKILKAINDSGYNCMVADESTFDNDCCKIIRSDGQVLQLGEGFDGKYKNLNDFDADELKNMARHLDTFYWEDTKEKFFDNWYNTASAKWSDIEAWYTEDPAALIVKAVAKPPKL